MTEDNIKTWHGREIHNKTISEQKINLRNERRKRNETMPK